MPLGSPPQGVKQRQVYVPALSTLNVKTVVENPPSGAFDRGTLMPSSGMLKVCAMFSFDTVVAAAPSRVMVPPATALYGEPAGSAVGASSYSLIVSTTVSPLAKVRSLGAIAGQCSLLVNVPAGPLSASILPIISMLTVFATGATFVAAGAFEPALDPPHADAVTAIAPTMSPTPIICRGLRCDTAVAILELMFFTDFTLSALGQPDFTRPGTDPALRAGAPIEVLPGPQACGTAIFPMTSDRSTHDQWVVSPVSGPRLAPNLMSMEAQVIRVVVVDDHALHRAGTRQILEAHPDLQVVGEADGGPAALALVNRLGPDVVLMDIRLPGMNGIEVTRQLTRDHADVRVLMVSAYDEDEYVRGALEAGAAGYLSKTAPGKELVQAVRSVAGGMSVLKSGLTARLLIAARQLDQAGDRQR